MGADITLESNKCLMKFADQFVKLNKLHSLTVWLSVGQINNWFVEQSCWSKLYPFGSIRISAYYVGVCVCLGVAISVGVDGVRVQDDYVITWH